MASFTFRGGRWQVRIRRKQSKTLTASFATKADAAKWARSVERDLDARRVPQSGTEGHSPFATMGDLLAVYEAHVTTKKKGAYAESRRIVFLRAHNVARVRLDSAVGLYDLANSAPN